MDSKINGSAPPVQSKDARMLAADVLTRVFKHGAFANKALDAELKRLDERGEFSTQQKAAVTELVYGTLRHVHVIEPALKRALDRPDKKIDAFAWSVMLMAVHELWFMSSPDYAVVSEAVALVKKKRSQPLSRFVNAVLRKVTKVERSVNDLERLPKWLKEELGEVLGMSRLNAWQKVSAPAVHLVVNVAKITRAELKERLESELPDRATVREHNWHPHGLVVTRGADPRRWPGYNEGLFSVQNLAAAAVVEAIDIPAGGRVADVCAGHGGKTFALAQRAAAVVAIDMYASKLAALAGEMHRLGATHVATEQLDVSVGLGGLEAQFDAVFVDAPCTGTGTWHQKPELLLRLGPDDAQRMSDIQLQILSNAVALLKPNQWGFLVYAVCSLTRDEGIGTTRRFESFCNEKNIRFEKVTSDFGLSCCKPDSDGVYRLGPWLGEGLLGFQLARWRLKRPQILQ